MSWGCVDLSLQPQPCFRSASRASALGTQGGIHPAKFRFPRVSGYIRARRITGSREKPGVSEHPPRGGRGPWGQRGLGWPGGCGMAQGCQGKFTSPAQASAPCLGHVQLGPGSLRPSWHPTAVGSRGRMWFLPPPAPVTWAQSIAGTGAGTLAPHLSQAEFSQAGVFPCLLPQFPQLASRANSSVSLVKCLGSPQEDFLADPPPPT